MNCLLALCIRQPHRKSGCVVWAAMPRRGCFCVKWKTDQWLSWGIFCSNFTSPRSSSARGKGGWSADSGRDMRKTRTHTHTMGGYLKLIKWAAWSTAVEMEKNSFHLRTAAPYIPCQNSHEGKEQHRDGCSSETLAKKRRKEKKRNSQVIWGLS